MSPTAHTFVPNREKLGLLRAREGVEDELNRDRSFDGLGEVFSGFPIASGKHENARHQQLTPRPYRRAERAFTATLLVAADTPPL